MIKAERVHDVDDDGIMVQIAGSGYTLIAELAAITSSIYSKFRASGMPEEKVNGIFTAIVFNAVGDYDETGKTTDEGSEND